MSMNNDSATNEKLISLLTRNVESFDHGKVNRLYHSIVNNTVLFSISHYKKYVTQTTPEGIAHHGCINPLITFNHSHRDHNIAVALKVLRKILPYSVAKRCTQNMTSDTLYHAINDFKYKLNSEFYTLFTLNK